ncbi:LysE family translocator [Mesorhizobium sp. Z1-4]|uniref:LysE family translocator n=1 Tax=Mesorhizobium sp. Z1-4 TaxID=2448478 RepID=UPI000FD7F8D1|nr:LysE family translocator [Mesorhizobium sp. Z1-4]
MADTAFLLSFALASFLIVIVPGPTVTVIIANSLKHGARAGLLNVLGTQIGLTMMIAILAVGMSAVVSSMGSVFEILRIAGAAYLIWLGIKMWRSDGALGEKEAAVRPMGSFVLQGFIVIWSNPKALLFFGAFIPQFIDPAGSAAMQTVVLGSIFMVVATLFDSVYAIAAGGAGGWLSRERVRLTERISGTFLIGGGLWLAFARR